MAVRAIRNDAADLRTVLRLDIGGQPIGNVSTTSQGFLRIPANLTKTGVLKYRTPDGRVINELRHPDDVNDPVSLATLSGAPVTDNHPAERLVSPGNVGAVQVGFQQGDVKPAGEFVGGDVIVQRQDAIDKVRAKKLKEISPGYQCVIDPTPGVWNGQPYDQRQTNITYNHIALMEPGKGRSGPSVALRNDDAYSVVDGDNDSTTKTKAPPSAVKETPMKTILIRLDGVTYEIQVPDAMAVSYESAIAKVQQERLDGIEALATLQGTHDALIASSKELQQRLDDAVSPAEIQRLVTERTEIEARAKILHPEIKCDGKDIETVQREVLEKKGFDRVVLDSKDSAYIAGAFAGLQVVAPKPNARLPGAPLFRQDSVDPKAQKLAERTPEMAREEMKAKNAAAWNTTGA